MKRKYQPIVVVYKRKWGNQKRMKVFTDLRSVDSILEDVKGKFIEIEQAGQELLLQVNNYSKILSESVGSLRKSSYIQI